MDSQRPPRRDDKSGRAHKNNTQTDEARRAGCPAAVHYNIHDEKIREKKTHLSLEDQRDLPNRKDYAEATRPARVQCSEEARPGDHGPLKKTRAGGPDIDVRRRVR